MGHRDVSVCPFPSAWLTALTPAFFHLFILSMEEERDGGWVDQVAELPPFEATVLIHSILKHSLHEGKESPYVRYVS